MLISIETIRWAGRGVLQVFELISRLNNLAELVAHLHEWYEPMARCFGF